MVGALPGLTVRESKHAIFIGFAAALMSLQQLLRMLSLVGLYQVVKNWSVRKVKCVMLGYSKHLSP